MLDQIDSRFDYIFDVLEQDKIAEDLRVDAPFERNSTYTVSVDNLMN